MSQPDVQTEVLDSVFHHQGTVRAVTSDRWFNLFEAEGFSAAIFDCDGTLVESSDAHMKSMQVAAEEQDFEMAADWYRARTGLDRRNLFQEFQALVEPGFDIERACKTSIECFYRFAHLVRPKEGVLWFATDMKARGVSIAVATNAERNVAEVSLTTIGASHLFHHLISISDGVEPKPSPEMFVLAAKRLDHPPNKVLVIEDSRQGVQAAVKAGMSVVQLI